MSVKEVKWNIRSLSKAFGNREYEIVNTTTMGRSVENDITINTTHLSRQHLKLIPRPSGLWLVDLGSKNGTYVNGKKVEHTMVGHGDVFSADIMKFEVISVDEIAESDCDRTMLRSSPS